MKYSPLAIRHTAYLFRQSIFSFLDQLSVTEHFSLAYFTATVISFVTTESPKFGAKRNKYHEVDMTAPTRMLSDTTECPALM